jgi:type III restriction enzyme
LVGKIAEGTTLTRKTVSKILSGIEPFRFKQFADNPEKFIAECVRIINEQKAAEIVEKIEYHILEETYSSDIFTKNQIVLPSQMSPIRPDGQMLQKHIFDYLAADSTREKEFARDLDTAEEVAVYAKLPGGFSIPTPVGNYNPDWAIAFKAGSVKHVYFIAETKGSMSEMQLREIERQKIACAKKFFAALEKKDTKYHVTYNNVASYADLLSAVGVSRGSKE